MFMQTFTVYIVQTARDRVFGWDPKPQLDPPQDLPQEDWRAEEFLLPPDCVMGKDSDGNTSVFRWGRYVPIIINPAGEVCMIDSTVDTFAYIPRERA